MKDNLIKKAYISAFDIEDKHLKDLIVVNTKCLIDDNIQRCVYIDDYIYTLGEDTIDDDRIGDVIINSFKY